MSEDPNPATEEPVDLPQPETVTSHQDEEDIGDFITRHVLEKDSVFFEG